MKRAKAFSLIILCQFILAGCAQTTYKEFIGGREVVGMGGTLEVVEGIEVWENGSPSRPFKVIGIIEDQRKGGLISRATRLPDIALKAKEAGGDALVIYEEESEIAGFINNSYASTSGSAYAYSNQIKGSATTTTSGYSVPIKRLYTKAAVIKYSNLP